MTSWDREMQHEVSTSRRLSSVLLIDAQPVAHSSASQQQQSLGSYLKIMFLIINSYSFPQSYSFSFDVMLLSFRTQRRTATIMNILTMRMGMASLLKQPQTPRQPHKKPR